MRVLRLRRTVGYVALLALIMQVALALAHTHVHARLLERTDSLAARAVTYGMCRSSADWRCPPQAPRHDESQCPLCWSISAASTGVLHTPAVIELRRPVFEGLAPAPGTPGNPGVLSVKFQARAPPLA